MNKLNPLCDAPPPAGAAPSSSPLAVPLPRLRDHIEHLLGTHTEAPSLAAALREVFRVEEGWFVPELLPPDAPVVMLFMSVDPARPVGQVVPRASLTRLPTTGLWSLRYWELDEVGGSSMRRSPPTVGPDRAVALVYLAISMKLLHVLGAWSGDAPAPAVLAETLCALGLPAEVTTGHGVPSVLAGGWVLARGSGGWMGWRLGGAWAGPLDTVSLALDWARQFAQGEGKGGQEVYHG